MPTNDFLKFSSTDTGTNLLTQVEYAADAQRTIGNQPGTARSKLVNKVLRQTSAMVYAIASMIESNTGNDILDDDDSATLQTNLEAAIVEIAGNELAGISGSVISFAGAVAPTGWLLCNGAAVSRTTYATLFSIISTTYGVGNGSTTFNLPDLRGEFIRGFDAGRGVDSGRTLGSWQEDEFKSHVHEINVSSNEAGSGQVTVGNTFIGNYETVAAGGAETRPRNVAMNYIIKY